MTTYRDIVSKLIDECKDEPDIDKKVQILYFINSILPKPDKLKIPSLLTDDYIDSTLDKIEIKKRHLHRDV
jgi:hypothetical protein